MTFFAPTTTTIRNGKNNNFGDVKYTTKIPAIQLTKRPITHQHKQTSQHTKHTHTNIHQVIAVNDGTNSTNQTQRQQK